MLKDYDMKVHYHIRKGNVVDDALNRISMASTSHIKDGKKELVKHIHRLDKLGVLLVDYTSWGV